MRAMQEQRVLTCGRTPDSSVDRLSRKQEDTATAVGSPRYSRIAMKWVCEQDNYLGRDESAPGVDRAT